MAFLQEAKKFDVARQLNAKIAGATAGVQQIKDARIALQNQIISMKANPDDYTEGDWKEVQAGVSALDALIDTIKE